MSLPLSVTPASVQVNIWSIGNPNALMCLSGHTSGVDCVTFDPAEEVVASGSASGAIKLFDLTTGKGEWRR